MTALDAVTVVLFWGAVAGAVTFPVMYHFATGGAWRGSPMGRHLMAFMAGLAVIMGMVAWARTVGPLHPSARLFVYGLLACLFWWRNWLLVKAQRRGRRVSN